jgi:hypothetical protein
MRPQPARRVAERGARKLVSEIRAQVQRLKQEGDAGEDEIAAATRRADIYGELAAEFKAGGPFLPGQAFHEAAYQRGLMG